MLDKVFCRIGDLETACSEALLLQESLIQSKDHLREGEKGGKDRVPVKFPFHPMRRSQTHSHWLKALLSCSCSEPASLDITNPCLLQLHSYSHHGSWLLRGNGVTTFNSMGFCLWLDDYKCYKGAGWSRGNLAPLDDSLPDHHRAPGPDRLLSSHLLSHLPKLSMASPRLPFLPHLQEQS